MIPDYPIADEAVYEYWLKAHTWSTDQVEMLLVGLNPTNFEVRKHHFQARRQYRETMQYKFDPSGEFAEKVKEIHQMLGHIGDPMILYLDFENKPQFWLDLFDKAALEIPPAMQKVLSRRSPDKHDNNEKPLTPTERNTLLIIIAALAKEAKIDITRPAKAGELIAGLTQQMGVPVDHQTITNKLKEIPDALERRAK